MEYGWPVTHDICIRFILGLSAAKQMFAALSEYRCYDTVNGLYTLPEGLTQDMRQLQSQSPPHYMDHLFNRIVKLQALHLTEFEEHLLKSVSLFNPGKISEQEIFISSRNMQFMLLHC